MPKFIADAVSNSVANAAASYSTAVANGEDSSGGQDIDDALTALGAAASAAVTEEAALSTQTNAANISSAAASVNAMVPQPTNGSGPTAGSSTGSNYQAALGLVQQIQAWLAADAAASGGGGGGGGGTNPALTNASVLAAMQAMLQVSDFTSSAACAPVKAFQSAWNSAGGTPTLTVDGGYGPNTASAAGQVAAANGGGNVPSALTSGYPNCGGTPTPPSPTPPSPRLPSSPPRAACRPGRRCSLACSSSEASRASGTCSSFAPRRAHAATRPSPPSARASAASALARPARSNSGDHPRVNISRHPAGEHPVRKGRSP